MPQLKPFKLAENMLVFAGQESHPNLASVLESALKIGLAGCAFCIRRFFRGAEPASRFACWVAGTSSSASAPDQAARASPAWPAGRVFWGLSEYSPDLLPRVTESQNHRIVGVGRDLCGSSSPTPLPKQGHLQ